MQELFFSQRGFYAGSIQTLDDELLDPLLSGTDELVLSGKWRRVRMQQLFEDACALIQPTSVRVLRSPGRSFIVGDVPVVTRTTNGGRVNHGVLGGSPIAAAQQVFFPLRPDRAVCLSSSSDWITLSDSEVIEFNTLQAQTAINRIYYQPDTVNEADLRRIRLPSEGLYASA